MKAYTRRSFTAAGIIATLGLTGCFSPTDNKPEAVYGPPEDFEDYKPDDNELAGVYGPPSTDS